MATTPTPTAQPTRVRPAWLVILLCWLIVVFDGYDLIVYGTTLPSILAEPGWGLIATSAGLIGSLAFLGMLVGALAAGCLADALGRRRTALWCTLWFSLFTALCYVAPQRGDVRRLPLHHRPRPRLPPAQRQRAHRRVRLGPRPLRRRDDHVVRRPGRRHCEMIGV